MTFIIYVVLKYHNYKLNLKMNMQAKLLLPGFEKDLSDSEVVSMDSPYEYERLKPEHRGETCPKFDSQKSLNFKNLL